MALATLSIDLEARLAKLQEGLDKGVRIAEKNAAEMARAYDGVGTAITEVASAVAAAFGTGVLAQFARQAIDGMDALNDFADAVGTSVENASALEDTALRTGTALDTVQSAALRLNKVLADAKPGSDTARVLQSIGLSAEELRRADPADALLLVAKALDTYGTSGNKARLVQELFGKSVAEVAPFLKDLAERGKLVATVTTEQAAEAEKFNKQLAELRKNFSDVARAGTSELLPFVNNYLEALKKLPSNFSSYKLEFNAQAASLDLQIAVSKVEDLQAALAKEPYNTGLANALKKAREEADRLLKSASAAADAARGAVGTPDDYSNEGRNSPKPQAPGLPVTSTGKREIPAAIRDPRQQTQADFLRSEKGAYDQVTKALADQADELDRLLAATDAGRLSALQRQLQDLLTLDATGARGEMAADAIRRTREEIDRLQQARRGPAIADQSERLRSEFLLSEKGGYDATDEALRSVGAATKETADLAKELGLTFSSAFEDAIVSGGNLRDLLQGIQQDLFRMATRKLVTEPLANGLGGLFEGLMGGGGGGGGGGAAAVGAAGADVLKSFFSGWFADGGYIPPGRWGMAGERGPEPVFGGRTGATVVPNGGGSVTINYVMPAGGMSTASQKQIAADTARLLSISSRRNN